MVSVAPYASRGLEKMAGRLIATAPGDEVAALRALAEDGEVALDFGGVILVGERLAQAPGALSAAVNLARTTGARLAWVPRRAGDRGALDAGCLPTLLPGGRPVAEPSARVDLATAWGVDHLPDAPGRDAEEILAAAAAGELGALVVAGIDPDDTADPAAARAALAAASFVVALELRETEVTRAADVVFPVAPATDKAGTFTNWEGRARPFEAVFETPASLPDLRVLAGIAEELDRPLGWRTGAEVREEIAQVGAWDGDRPEHVPHPEAHPAAHPTAESDSAAGLALATWKQQIDLGSMQAGADALRATARPAVVRLPASAGFADGDLVVVSGDRGSVTLPVLVEPTLVEGCAWLPTNSFGDGVWADVAGPGSRITVKGAEL